MVLGEFDEVREDVPRVGGTIAVEPCDDAGTDLAQGRALKVVEHGQQPAAVVGWVVCFTKLMRDLHRALLSNG